MQHLPSQMYYLSGIQRKSFWFLSTTITMLEIHINLSVWLTSTQNHFTYTGKAVTELYFWQRRIKKYVFKQSGSLHVCSENTNKIRRVKRDHAILPCYLRRSHARVISEHIKAVNIYSNTKLPNTYTSKFWHSWAELVGRPIHLISFFSLEIMFMAIRTFKAS